MRPDDGTLPLFELGPTFVGWSIAIALVGLALMVWLSRRRNK